MHQLDVEVVAAEVAYTMTNTQSSCSGGGESNRVPNTFKEAMDFPQAMRWKAKSDKEIASLEKHDVFKLVPIDSVPAGHMVVSTRWVFKIKTKGTYKGRLVVQVFFLIPSIDTPGVGPEVLSLNQLEEKLLNEEDKRCYQAITGAVHVSRTSHPLRHSLHGQPAGKGHVQARESSYGGGQASFFLLSRVQRILHLALE